MVGDRIAAALARQTGARSRPWIPTIAWCAIVVPRLPAPAAAAPAAWSSR